MARTKDTARQRHLLATTTQPRTKHADRAIDAARSAVKHAAVSKMLLHPIAVFRIPITKAELSMDQWDAYTPQRFYYGVPNQIKYGPENNQLEFLRVPVMKEQQLFGYVLLPIKYDTAWMYLCWNVEYWLAMWKSWNGELEKMMEKNGKKRTTTQRKKADLVATSRKNVGARFLEAMVARRTVLEECVANGLNDGRISSLDEFIIRNLRDWLFMEITDLPGDAGKYLEADPLHPENQKLFHAGWGGYRDPILTMLEQNNNMWVSEGIDVSATFKKGMRSALKTLKDGGEDVDITYDKDAKMPTQWHECHEPPIRFISVRKDKFLQDGFRLDEPLVFLYQCLRAEEEIERADFLREIMDMLATDEAKYQWSLRVDQLMDGEITWDIFSDIVADGLNLELDARANAIGPDGVEPDFPFLKLDALIAVRTYLYNLQNKPEKAASFLNTTIYRLFTPDAEDYEVWNWVIQTVSPGTVTTVLKQAHERRSKSSNAGKAIAADQTNVAPMDLESVVDVRFSIIIDDLVGDIGSDRSPNHSWTCA